MPIPCQCGWWNAYGALIQKILPNKDGHSRLCGAYQAVLMQESGGRGLDPTCRRSEGQLLNTRYPHEPKRDNKTQFFSIECGVQELKAAPFSLCRGGKNRLHGAYQARPLQVDNFGYGYILDGAKTIYAAIPRPMRWSFPTHAGATVRLGSLSGDIAISRFQWPCRFYIHYGRGITKRGNQANCGGRFDTATK